MFDMMGKLGEMKAQAEKTKERLNSITVEGQDSQHKVKVIATGNRAIKSVNIDPELMQDKDMLEDFLIIALNDALSKAEKVQEAEMGAVAKGMLPNIPGLG